MHDCIVYNVIHYEFVYIFQLLLCDVSRYVFIAVSLSAT